MNSGKCISAGFLIAVIYGLIRFLIFEAAFKIHIEENVPAHIAFTIAVVGFVVLDVKLIPEKYIRPLYSIPSIALLALLFIGMSCCVDSCKEKGDKNDSKQQGATVKIEPAKPQKKSSSEKPGKRVKILPAGKKIQKKEKKPVNDLRKGWGYKSTQINNGK